MQHAAERMPYPPNRLGQPLQLLDELIEQIVPVVIHRETRVVPMTIHVGDLIFRRQSVEQLAIGR